MPKTKTPTPWDIAIKFHPAATYPGEGDVNHATIEVSCAHSPDDHTYTLAETIAGYRWCAGIISRLACGALADDLARERRDHGCQWLDDCRPGCGARLLEYDPTSLDDSPMVSIDLPAEADTDVWIEHIEKTLNAIIEADRWQPSAQDEADWSAK